MNNKIINPRIIFIISIIIIGAILRLVIDIPNFTPIAAIALFGGAYLSRKYLAFILPLLILFITDLLIGFYDIEVMIPVYLSFLIVVSIGLYIRRRLSVGSIILASISSSLIFFLITNFAVWVSGMVGYPMSFGGLLEAYFAGLPFLRFEIIGTLSFNTILFGSFYLVRQAYPELTKA
ncbi:DUF6580 family putative transport protein [Bacteroidota bacterium]